MLFEITFVLPEFAFETVDVVAVKLARVGAAYPAILTDTVGSIVPKLLLVTLPVCAPCSSPLSSSATVTPVASP